jgi:outer membrane protein
MTNRRRALWSGAALSLVLSLAASMASAETLADAIALAYETNPTLQGQRATQRALDENYVQARSAYRPTADLGLTTSYTDSSFGGDSSSQSLTLSATQPVWTGGRATRGVDAARSDVEQGRQNLRAVEAQILASVIQSYVDVRRDTEALRINQANVAVLQRQLDEASARFEVGEITRTDVAQAEARLASAQASLAASQAQLSSSRAAYTAVVGQSPADLEPEPALAGVPTSFEEAIGIAERENANIRAAKAAEEASRARVAQARAQYAPSVNLSATYGSSDRIRDFADNFTDNDSATARATLSIPIFTGGLTGSRIRQSIERNNASIVGIEAARRDVLRLVSQNWATVLSARAALTANEEQVRAAQIAAEGVRQEAQVGLRTTLDVLNAELELRNAQLSLVGSRRDQYVATALLLSAMGKLEAANLVGVGTGPDQIELYDPRRNFNRVKNKGRVPVLEPVVEALDHIGAPSGEHPFNDQDAPIDTQLETIATNPQATPITQP